MWRVIREQSNEQMITRFWPRRGCRQSKRKQWDRNNRSQKSPSLGDPKSGSNAIFSRRNLFCCEQKQAADRAETDRWMVWLSTDSRYSKAAVAMCAYQKGLLVQKRVPCRWAVSFPDENVFTTDGKGICRNSWRKRTRCPRRLRVPSLNKISQTARDRPPLLWEFRAANCFRDLIATLQNENLRWSGLSYLNRITGTRRSVSKGRIMLVPFAPLECKGIRSASRRWWSFQNLWWSQVLTSVHNSISQN